MHRGFFGFFLGRFPHPNRGQSTVLKDRQMREEVEVLETHANFGPDLVDVL